MSVLDASQKAHIVSATLESFAIWKKRSGESWVTVLGREPPIDDDLRPLQEAIQSLPQFQEFDGWYAWTKGQQSLFSAGRVTDWVFPRYSNENHANESAEKLDRLLSNRLAPISYMTAIWGAVVPERVSLAGGVALYPFGTLNLADADDFKKNQFWWASTVSWCLSNSCRWTT